MIDTLMPLAPQQKHVVSLIAVRLEDRQVENPLEVALDIWRITRTKRRPVVKRLDR